MSWHQFTFSTVQAVLKVSKYRKQILKFSFATKNERKYFCISALASKKRSNQKSRVRESKYNPPISGIKCLYFFDLTRNPGKNFVGFLEEVLTLKGN